MKRLAIWLVLAAAVVSMSAEAQREPTPVTRARSNAQVPVEPPPDAKGAVGQPRSDTPATKPDAAIPATKTGAAAQRSPNEVPSPPTRARGNTQIPTQTPRQGSVVPPIAAELPTRAPSTRSKEPGPATPVTRASAAVPRGTTSVPTAILETPLPGGTRFGLPSWRCEGDTCTRSRFERDPVAECREFAQAAGRIRWFSTPSTFLSAAQLAFCNSPTVHEFEVTVCSGADDLRQNSTFHVTWIFEHANYDTTRGYPIVREPIPARACQQERVSGLWGSQPLIRLEALHFRFRGGRRSGFDEVDDWDLASLTVQATVIEPGGRRAIVRLIDDRTPRRLEDDRQWEVDLRSLRR